MSDRFSPEPISSIETGIADSRRHRPPNLPAPPRPAAPRAAASPEFDPPAAPPAEPPPLPERAGTAFVMAVLSGALAPRPTSVQEVLLRTGTGWVPPDSDYRLADKKI